MPRRNHYLVLGIAENESREGVRRAFRDLAHRYHPDRAGPRSAPYFREIVSAYRTLTDPDRRSSYDAGLRDARRVESPLRARPWPPAQVEPLVPRRTSVMHDFRVTRPSRDEVLDRIQRNFTDERTPKADRLQALRLQLVISAEDALGGGVLSLGVPAFYPCMRCRGGGHVDGYGCTACDGAGIRESEETVHLRVSPGVRDGDVFELPLRGLGIHNLFLSVCVRVGR